MQQRIPMPFPRPFLNLIEAVRKGAGPLQRFLNIRREALGVEQLEIWDMYAPIVEPTISNISFDEASGHCRRRT